MNETNLALSAAVAILFAAGSYLLMQRTLVRVVLGFLLLGHGANLVLFIGGGPAGRAPVAGHGHRQEMADPLPQAMALTAIVITFGVTALLLAFAHRGGVLEGHDEFHVDVVDQELRRSASPSEGEEPT